MTARKRRLVYAASAVAGLVRLRAFIAEHDPATARRIAANLVRRIEALRDTPLIGHVVATAPDPAPIRDMVLGTSCVRYAAGVRTVAVLRVWHHLEQRDRSASTSGTHGR